VLVVVNRILELRRVGNRTRRTVRAREEARSLDTVPAVVPADQKGVQFFPRALADVAHDQAAVGLSHGEAERIAKAVGIDLLAGTRPGRNTDRPAAPPGARLVPVGIVERARSVAVDAQELAAQRAEPLRVRVELSAVADGDVEGAVEPELDVASV